MPLPRTKEEYCAIQVAAMKRHLLATPALDFAILTVHDNDNNPIFTRRIQRKAKT
jgi:hypothetical protein